MRLAALIMALSVSACAVAADCSVAPVTVDGRPLAGIEDIALMPDGGTLLLSAHDRGAPDGGTDGIFTLPVAALDDIAPEAVPLPGLPNDLNRPHGIAVDRTGARLAFIHRPGGATGPDHTEVLWGTLGPEGFVRSGMIDGERVCRANDLTFAADRLLVTLDRRGCDIETADFTPWAETGRVLTIEPDGAVGVTRERFAFANGILWDGDRAIVAETRAGALSTIDGSWLIELPGGPDNLSFAPDGRVIAALHPSALRIFFGLKLGVEQTPSLIVSADLETGAVRTLYEDTGSEFSAATSALIIENTLVAGSVLDKGLLVCRNVGPGKDTGAEAEFGKRNDQ
ncbi:MAG: hypothetical protein NXI16_00920 [Alphaproteobacteria bacterium]|nr:hypothetical protein [Alphaproteobacteria bacterium]